MHALKRSPSIFIVIFLGLIFIILTSCKQNKNAKNIVTDKSNKIDEIVNLYSDYGMINGAVLVADKGEIIYKKGIGLANMEWGIPNKTDTKFQIASMTKSFTALLIIQLVAEGKLDLHTPISTYLKDYPKTNGDQITIHHLLTHSAGFDRSVDDKKYNKPVDMVNQFSSAKLQFPPGTRFGYSNNGYTLLGYIIETVTGKPYEEQLKERIFEPLKMKNSGFFKHRPIIKNMASGYYKGFGEYFDNDSSDESTAYAAGAIYSTVEDLFLWDQALNTKTLLPKKYRDLLSEKHIIDSDEGGHYGYGLELKNKPVGNTSEMVETIGHSGSIGGFRSLITKIPSTNSTIILLNNTNRAFFSSLTTTITGILNNKPYDLPLIPLAKFMVKTIENEGVEKGIQFYKEHKDSPEYYASEQELIVAGYRFLHAENAKDAAKIFKLSTEVFPDRDNPYDSYAEALRALGKNTEAIENYKISVELNPKNNNAIDMLKELGVTYSVDLLNADDTWGKEIITFPIEWAPKMTVKGYEDLRFAPEWSKAKHKEFWSLVMAWKVVTTTEISLDELQVNLESYYDGLMTPNHWSEEFPKPKLKLFALTKNETGTNFKGKITIFDGFHTGKVITLNILGEQQLCEKTGNSIIIFKFSPKAYSEPIWKQLNKINLKADCNSI
ncbi:serine hydrolase [Psychroserpens sp.]